MLIKLESRLRYIQSVAEEEESPAKGTLAVINGELDFGRTDAYIQFLKLVLDYTVKVYGKQDPGWQEQLDSLYVLALKLKEDNVRFKGSTKEEFREYSGMLSGLPASGDAAPLPAIGLDIRTSDDLVPFMERCVQKIPGIVKGFLITEEDMDKNTVDICIAHDLMMSLSTLKMNKDRSMMGISRFLRYPGYHEHVADAMNVLIQAGVYAVNCSSTRERKAYAFDLQHIDSAASYASLIMERTKYVV